MQAESRRLWAIDALFAATRGQLRKKTHLNKNKTDSDDAAEKEALAGKAEADDFV